MDVWAVAAVIEERARAAMDATRPRDPSQEMSVNTAECVPQSGLRDFSAEYNALHPREPIVKARPDAGVDDLVPHLRAEWAKVFMTNRSQAKLSHCLPPYCPYSFWSAASRPASCSVNYRAEKTGSPLGPSSCVTVTCTPQFLPSCFGHECF